MSASTHKIASLFIGLAGAAAVAGIAAGIGFAKLAQSPSTADGMPSGLRAFTVDGLQADRVDSPVAGLNAWVLHTPSSPGSTPQLAVSAPGSDGFVVGELFTADGIPANNDIMGSDARSRTRFVDLGVTTQWVPITQGGESNRNSVYLFASPLDPQMQSLWSAINANRSQLPEIRFVPTAYGTPDAFEAVLDVFIAAHGIGGSNYASQQRLTRYLTGDREVPQSLRDEPTPEPAAVNALSSNGNIRHTLRLGAKPTVIAPADDGSLEILSLATYLNAKAGVSSDAADNSDTPITIQGVK